MVRPCWLDIMAHKKNGTIYVGRTKNLTNRVMAHKEDRGAIFVKKHQVRRLVFFREYPDYMTAGTEEGRVKKRWRAWKLQLIESKNPDRQDFYLDLNK